MDAENPWVEIEKDARTSPTSAATSCPRCGYCPHCGRGFTPPYHVPYYGPYWQIPVVCSQGQVNTSFTTGDYTSRSF